MEIAEDPLFSNDDYLSYDVSDIYPIQPDISMGAAADEVKNSLARVYDELKKLPPPEETAVAQAGG